MKPVTVPPKVREALDGINQAVGNLSDPEYANTIKRRRRSLAYLERCCAELLEALRA